MIRASLSASFVLTLVDLQAGLACAAGISALTPYMSFNDGQTSIVYNIQTGELSVDAPAGKQLTSINIDSASGIFTGAPAENLGGSFDNDTDHNIFKATFGSSFGSISFGPVAQQGLSNDFVANDLTVVGSLDGGGGLGSVDCCMIPEPRAATLASIGIAIMLAVRWQRRCQPV